MARVPSPPILSQIRTARTYSEQAAALRALKDEVIGHVQRKERWVECGTLESLVETLQANNRPAASLNGIESRGQGGHSGALAEDEVVRLLSLQLLASFAYGGPSFLGPLNAVGVVPVILSNISPLDNPPQVVLTALRALRNITDSTRLAPPGADDASSLSEAVLSSRNLDAFCAILAQESASAVVQEQKRLVATLISRLCKGQHHQNALADGGILDALATMLASFVVARGEVVPGAELLGQSDGLADLIPPPAPRGADLALVLEAISAIIADSRFRCCLLLCSPALMAVFPTAEFTPPATESRAAWNALEMSGLGTIRAKNPGAIDYLLPVVPNSQPRALSSHSAQFPPLGFSLSRENLAASGRPSTFKFTGWDSGRFDASAEDIDGDDPESPLIPWLIHLVRSTHGLERVMAASVLASLFKARFTSPEREQALAVLVIPLLCQLMKEHDKEVPSSMQQAAFIGADVALDWAIQEQTPEVLARLVTDSEPLQQAAHECGAIKTVSKLLKDAYDPQLVQTPPRPWSPNPYSAVDSNEGPPMYRIGPPGQVPAYAHKIKMRESALKLVAAMSTLKDEYRKALAEQDVVPYIVESLSPSPEKPKNAKEKPAPEKGTEDGDASGSTSPYGHNPNTVIIAACHAARALGRSVGIVRTTLYDHNVAMPISKLLRHPDAEVQIAASSVVINLVTNCSPMLEPLLQAGIVKTLCEHAHSLNPGLRLNSLWALKHLVLDVDNSLRKQCLEELEPGWLVQLISDDTSEDESLHARLRPERRPTDADEDEDEDMDADDDDDDYEDDSNNRSWVWPAMRRFSTASSMPLRAPSSQMQQAGFKLAALRDAELNPARKARNDSLAIQEQGLGFIRNLILLSTPANQTEMVDYLFSELGQDRLFGILADKLKVRVVGAYGRRHSKGRDTVVLYPQARIIENLTYILVHIAASIPRHRQLVIAQTELLKLLGGHFNSKDVGVRRALCQLNMNLSCLDSDSDRQPCSQRASELERLGFLAKLEGLGQGDCDLDVRERAKAAVSQMKTPTA
ncbi:hypothetical protein MFIFM68171_03181 [Madurella fahalii]|uniref:Armadillo repeat-containing protein 8 n=1 Tax=Madurella fahalii TaxID=1157608 RepID=A0ABQ0G5F2_9PEZI